MRLSPPTTRQNERWSFYLFQLFIYFFLVKEIKLWLKNYRLFAIFENTHLLHFIFPDPPIVTLRLGSTLSADDIKEGDDVYFECHVSSNPPWRRLLWLYDVCIYKLLYLILKQLLKPEETSFMGHFFRSVAKY